jgi:phage-related protein
VFVRYSADGQAPLGGGDLPGVETWYASLKSKDKAVADRAFDRLAQYGPELRMPHARPLGGGLCELRFTCEGTARRVTYYIDTPRKVITLTTFRKQRQAERREVARARQAMRASQQKGGTNG